MADTDVSRRWHKHLLRGIVNNDAALVQKACESTSAFKVAEVRVRKTKKEHALHGSSLKKRGLSYKLGDTALHIAARNAKREAVSGLLRVGADATKENKEGKLFFECYPSHTHVTVKQTADFDRHGKSLFAINVNSASDGIRRSDRTYDDFLDLHKCISGAEVEPNFELPALPKENQESLHDCLDQYLKALVQSVRIRKHPKLLALLDASVLLTPLSSRSVDDVDDEVTSASSLDESIDSCSTSRSMHASSSSRNSPGSTPAVEEQVAVPGLDTCRRVFEQIDEDGSGTLSLAELSMGVSGVFHWCSNRSAFIKAYKAADLDGNGYIMKEEFQSLLGFALFFNSIWDQLDEVSLMADDTGELSGDQFHEACEYMAPEIGPVDDAYALFDAIKVGETVSFGSFCTWIARERLPRAFRCPPAATRSKYDTLLEPEVPVSDCTSTDSFVARPPSEPGTSPLVGDVETCPSAAFGRPRQRSESTTRSGGLSMAPSKSLSPNGFAAATADEHGVMHRPTHSKSVPDLTALHQDSSASIEDESHGLGLLEVLGQVYDKMNSVVERGGRPMSLFDPQVDCQGAAVLVAEDLQELLKLVHDSVGAARAASAVDEVLGSSDRAILLDSFLEQLWSAKLHGLRKKFRSGTFLCGVQDWGHRMTEMQKSNGGRMRFQSLVQAVRLSTNIPPTIVTDEELHCLFKAAEDEHTGETVVSEFIQLVNLEHKAPHASIGDLFVHLRERCALQDAEKVFSGLIAGPRDAAALRKAFEGKPSQSQKHAHAMLLRDPVSPEDRARHPFTRNRQHSKLLARLSKGCAF